MAFATMTISRIAKNVCFTCVAPRSATGLLILSAASLLPQHCCAIDDAIAQVPS